MNEMERVWLRIKEASEDICRARSGVTHFREERAEVPPARALRFFAWEMVQLVRTRQGLRARPIRSGGTYQVR